MKIKFFTTGGTIDKVYFDEKSSYQVGVPKILEILKGANANFDYEVESLLKKDSLDMTEHDRKHIFIKVKNDRNERIVITHGTDTMLKTAQMLQPIPEKVIVLTGSMQPAGFANSDAVFNVGGAIAAVQVLPFGVYIVMNGLIFNPNNSRKNMKKGRFEFLD